MIADRAAAQVSLTATAETEYRLRGVALTDDPDLRLGLAYDHGSGAYGGGALIIGAPDDGDIDVIGHIAYLGYARRLGNGLTLDLGATTTRVANTLPVRAAAPTTPGGPGVVYPSPLPGYTYPDPQAPTQITAPGQTVGAVRYKARYNEVYAGLIRDNLSAHVYLSPDYLGEGTTTAYLDFNGAVRPLPRLRLFGHVGVLAWLGGGTNRVSRHDRYDLRTGVALELGRAEVQLAWTLVGPQVQYPIGYPQKRQGLVLSATAYF